MTVLTEGLHTAEFIIREARKNASRTAGAVLAAGNNLDAGAVLGQLTLDEAVVSAGAGNTGTASLAAVSATLGSEAEPGIYVLRCTAASANAGTFSVKSPSGKVLADLTVASAYTSTHISLTIPDGAVDWAVGDMIYVAVGSEKWTELDPNAEDGSHIAAGILYGAVDATDADTPCVVVYRDAHVNDAEISWPAGITDEQKTAAKGQLKMYGIELVTGVA